MMDKITNIDVNITEIKYDNATNSMLIDLSDQPRWTIPCKHVLGLDERTEDVAPYFLCFFLDKLEEEGYSVLKSLKVFTVFIEHEGVLHLRKYDNLIKKIKAGRMKDATSAGYKVALVDDEGVADGSENAESLLDMLRNAGMEVDIVKPKKKKPTLVSFSTLLLVQFRSSRCRLCCRGHCFYGVWFSFVMIFFMY